LPSVVAGVLDPSAAAFSSSASCILANGLAPNCSVIATF
jgi:hypothetical protein